MNDSRMILDEVLNCSLDRANIQLCLASNISGNIPTFHRVNISDNVTAEFREILNKLITGIKNNSDLALRKYDAQAKLDKHEIEFLSLNEHTEIVKQFNTLNNVTSLEVFALSEKFIAGLKFYSLVVTIGGDSPIIFFRTYSSKKN